MAEKMAGKHYMGPEQDTDPVSWDLVGRQMAATLYMLALLLLVHYPLRRLYMRERGTLKNAHKPELKVSGVRAFVVRLLGPPCAPPKDGYGEMAAWLFIFQFVLSSATCVLWVQKSYVTKVYNSVAYMELGMACFFAAWFILKWMKEEMAWRALFHVDMLLDLVTTAPLLLHMLPEHHEPRAWISLSFLRCFSAVGAYRALDSSGLMDDWGDVRRGVVSSALESVMVVFVLAATALFLEVLGPMEYIEDSFIVTVYGDHLSMAQMMYWSMTVASTVGYGEFVPKTMLSRGFNAFAIVLGVVFFTVETGELYRLKQLEESGRGKFIPKKSDKGHVLILGGACDKNAVVVLRLFLEELLNPARGVELPEVVLLCFTEADEEMLKFLREPSNKELVTFLRGKSLLIRDLRRARADRAAMCFVLADIFTTTPDYEDQHNILNSTLLIKNYPRLPLRVMLLRPENRTLAVEVGVPLNFCFAINELKAYMMAQTCINHGFIPFVLNLGCIFDTLREEDTEKRERTRNKSKLRASGLYRALNTSIGRVMNKARLSSKKSPAQAAGLMGGVEELASPLWMKEYMAGAAHAVHGMLVSKEFDGMTFSAVANAMYARSGVFALAHLYDGKININPSQTVVRHNDVLFVVARDRDVQLAALTERDDNQWVTKLREARQIGRATEYAQKAALMTQHGMSMEQANAVIRFTQESSSLTTKRVKRRRARARDHKPKAAATSQADAPAPRRMTMVKSDTWKQENESHGDFLDMDEKEYVRKRGVIAMLDCVGETAEKERSPLEDSDILWGSKPRPPDCETSDWVPALDVVPAFNAHARAIYKAAKQRLAINILDMGHSCTSTKSVTALAPSTASASSSSPLPGAKDDVQTLHLRQMVMVGGHLLVIAIDNNLWQQVAVMLAALREEFLEEWTPVVMLCPYVAPEYLVSQFDHASGVIFYQGNPLNASNLLAAGAIVAENIILLQNQPTSPLELQMDQHLLVAASLIEAEQADLSHDVHMVVDIHSPRNISQLFYEVPGATLRIEKPSAAEVASSGFLVAPEAAPRGWGGIRASKVMPVSSGNQLSRAASSLSLIARKEVRASDPEPAGLSRRMSFNSSIKSQGFSSPGQSTSVPHTQDWGSTSFRWAVGRLSKTSKTLQEAAAALMAARRLAKKRYVDSLEPTQHPRYAAGRMMSKVHLCRIFATAFYTPGVLEVIEALAMPTNRQQEGMLWLVPVPFRFIGMTFGQVFKQLNTVGVLSLGLYRAAGSLDNDLQYVMSFPEKDTVIKVFDQLYVHAPPDWAGAVKQLFRKEHAAAHRLQKAWKRVSKVKVSRRLPWKHRSASVRSRSDNIAEGTRQST